MVTKQEEFNEFLTQQKDPSYKLGDITGTPDGDMVKYTELKIAVSQEAEKIGKFNAAKQEAFKELSAKHDDELVALGKLWQGYEDNNYEIPQ